MRTPNQPSIHSLRGPFFLSVFLCNHLLLSSPSLYLFVLRVKITQNPEQFLPREANEQDFPHRGIRRSATQDRRRNGHLSRTLSLSLSHVNAEPANKGRKCFRNNPISCLRYILSPVSFPKPGPPKNVPAVGSLAVGILESWRLPPPPPGKERKQENKATQRSIEQKDTKPNESVALPQLAPNE